MICHVDCVETLNTKRYTRLLYEYNKSNKFCCFRGHTTNKMTRFLMLAVFSSTFQLRSGISRPSKIDVRNFRSLLGNLCMPGVCEYVCVASIKKYLPMFQSYHLDTCSDGRALIQIFSKLVLHISPIFLCSFQIAR